MPAEPANRLTPESQARSTRKGDIPDQLRRRYLTDPSGGPGIGFFVDTTVTVAAFRDHGHRLSAFRTEPQVVRDLVAIALHRGWATVRVQGAPDFCREAWRAARLAGLEVRGHKPTARDLEDLARRQERRTDRSPQPPHVSDQRSRRSREAPDGTGAQTRLEIVEAVVRNRIVEPAEQARILAAARGRIADWLERGARFDDVGARARPRGDPERRRSR